VHLPAPSNSIVRPDSGTCTGTLVALMKASADPRGYVKELHLFRRRYFNGPGNMRRSNEQHRQLYEAIMHGAGAKARAVAERHVQEGTGAC
jgi:hypothetical protein